VASRFLFLFVAWLLLELGEGRGPHPIVVVCQKDLLRAVFIWYFLFFAEQLIFWEGCFDIQAISFPSLLLVSS